MACYSPWSHKELDTTQCVHTHTHTHTQLDERYTAKYYRINRSRTHENDSKSVLSTITFSVLYTMNMGIRSILVTTGFPVTSTEPGT